jgi:hypothetical protein
VALLRFQPLPCDEQSGFGSEPKCPPGVLARTLVNAFSVLGCDGLPRPESEAAQTMAGWLEGVRRFSAAYWFAADPAVPDGQQPYQTGTLVVAESAFGDGRYLFSQTTKGAARSCRLAVFIPCRLSSPASNASDGSTRSVPP